MLAAAAVMVAPAVAQPLTAKPIRLVMPFAASNPASSAVAAFAQAFERALGRRVELVQQPGGAGVQGWRSVAEAEADGGTLGIMVQPLFLGTHADPRWAATLTARSFRPVARLWGVDYGIAVPANSPFPDFSAFLAAARRRPDAVTIATGGRFHVDHMFIAMIERAANVQFEAVNFSLGPPNAGRALIGGHVDAMSGSLPDLAPFLAGGKARLLAVASDALQPGAASPMAVGEGLVIFRMSYGIVAPAGLSDDKAAELARAAEAALADPAVAAAVRAGGGVPLFLGPGAYAEAWAKEDAEIGAAILHMRARP